MATKKTSEPKAFEEFELTLAAVIKPGGETVHYIMTLDGVDVQPAARTATLADAPEVIEGLTATLEETYARYLTEQASKAAKKTKRSSKKPAAKKKPQAVRKPQETGAEPTEEDEQPEAEGAQEEVPANEEQAEAPEENEQDGEEEEEDTPEESPKPATEQISMLDGIDI